MTLNNLTNKPIASFLRPLTKIFRQLKLFGWGTIDFEAVFARDIVSTATTLYALLGATRECDHWWTAEPGRKFVGVTARLEQEHDINIHALEFPPKTKNPLGTIAR